MGRRYLQAIHQPLRPFGPPPHEWGGGISKLFISPSGPSGHLPINGEEVLQAIHEPLRPFGPPPHKWGGGISKLFISPSGPSGHLPMNGEEVSPSYLSAPPALRATSP